MRKLIAAIFGITALLCATNAEAAANVASPKKRVVVLDPGHGGVRHGAVHGGYSEKNLNLTISLKVRELLNERASHISIYMTREKDVAIHDDKRKDNRLRPKLANEKSADLFVSIHANAQQSGNDVRGIEVIVLNLSDKTQVHTRSMANQLRADEDFILFEDLDKEEIKYLDAIAMLMANDPMNRMFGEIVCKEAAKRGFISLGVKSPPTVYTVLYPLECPGVIVEMGYMSNSTDLKLLTSKEGQQKMAEAICDAIIKYMDNLDKMEEYSYDDSNAQIEESTQEELPANYVSDASGEGYTIQLLSSTKKLNLFDSQFKSYKGLVIEVQDSGTYKYKYCFGSYSSAQAAQQDLKQVRNTFKDAFITRYKAGKIVR